MYKLLKFRPEFTEVPGQCGLLGSLPLCAKPATIRCELIMKRIDVYVVYEYGVDTKLHWCPLKCIELDLKHR
jgi:hypothetical protein